MIHREVILSGSVQQQPVITETLSFSPNDPNLQTDSELDELSTREQEGCSVCPLYQGIIFEGDIVYKCHPFVQAGQTQNSRILKAHWSAGSGLTPSVKEALFKRGRQIAHCLNPRLRPANLPSEPVRLDAHDFPPRIPFD